MKKILLYILFASWLWAGGGGIYIQDAQIVEGDVNTTQILFPITLTYLTKDPLSIMYSTSDATAKAGKDYIKSSGLVTIPPFSNTANISILIINDKKFTKAERTFNVTLETKIETLKKTAVGTIIENDIKTAHSKESEIKGK